MVTNSGMTSLARLAEQVAELRRLTREDLGARARGTLRGVRAGVPAAAEIYAARAAAAELPPLRSARCDRECQHPDADGFEPCHTSGLCKGLVGDSRRLNTNRSRGGAR
jgi:hypothetical protein